MDYYRHVSWFRAAFSGGRKVKDSNVKRLYDLILDHITWKRDDLEYEKKLNPDSYRCGYNAGALSAFYIILDFIDFLNIKGVSEDE